MELTGLLTVGLRCAAVQIYKIRRAMHFAAVGAKSIFLATIGVSPQ
jgi:hypothetical protein